MGVSTGASFTGMTVKGKVTVLELTVLSLAVTLIIPVPLKLDAGVRVRTASVTNTVIFSVLLTALYVNESPSTSVAERVTANGVSSAVVWSAIEASTGASFTGLTVNVNDAGLEFSVPSFAVTVMVADPLKFSTGVMVRTLPVINVETADVSLSAEYVMLSPSSSVADKLTEID